MVFYSDFIYYSGTNDPVVNAAITVMIANTQTPADLFTSEIGNVIKPNPVTSDQTGFFSFYVAQGTYDLYFLGVKQYQISVNGTTGIPDPLTVGELNTNFINPNNGINLVIGSPIGDGVTKLQLIGTQRIIAAGFTSPIPSFPVTPPLRVIGNTVNTTQVRINTFLDTATVASGIVVTKNLLNGAYPPADTALGALRFGTLSAAGTEQTCTLIEGFSQEQLSDTNRGSGIRFSTTPNGTNNFAERMRITNSGNVLIGTTVDDGVNKLQVNGTIKSTGVQVAGVPSANKNTIDFYEFGTWTPVGVNAAVIAAGFAGNDPIVCNYQRIGKRVTIGISINVTGGGTSGPFSLGGLPFPVNSLIAPVIALCVGGNGGSYLWVANSGGATELHISPTNNIFSALTGIQAEAEQFIFGTVTYLTD